MIQFEDTLAYIDRIQRADSVEAVCQELLGVTGPFGLTAMIAGTVPATNTPPADQKDHVLMCDWPVDWLDRYIARNYVDHDPVVDYMKRLRAPFQWRDASQNGRLDRDALQVLGDAGEFGLSDGLAFPLVTLDGEVVVVSLGGATVELSNEEFGMVSLVATYAVGRAMQIRSVQARPAGQVDLTRREIECLQWAAEGKSEWEMSQIMGISEHTSGKHLLSAKNKLSAATRVQAVAEAIRRGFIT